MRSGKLHLVARGQHCSRMASRNSDTACCSVSAGSLCSSFPVGLASKQCIKHTNGVSGINLITYYAPSIFQRSVGLSQELSLLLAGFNGIAYFLSSLPPIWILDRLGRRKLMLFAVIGMCCCMSVLAGTVSNGNKASGIVASVMLFLFNFFFAVGMLAIPWLLPSEYAPLAVRTPIAALSSASNWIFTFRKCQPMRPLCQSHLLIMLFAPYSCRAHHSGINRKHRMEDIRLLWRVQRLLHSRHLLLL